MAIDAMIDRFRYTGCAYAIDGKQGGRLLSPLQDRSGVAWWNPLAQDPGGATFEIKQGLIQYGDNTVSSDNSGNLVSSNSTVLSRRILVPVDLR